MLTSSSKRRALFAVAVTFALAAPAFTGSASADPKQFGALVGVGSDTTENVINGFAGFDSGAYYTPLSSPTGNRQLISWDATAPAGAADNCISLAGGIKVQRPNGSGNGQEALSRAFDGVAVTNAAGGWGTTADCGPASNSGRQDVSGLIDFARSSSGKSSSFAGSDLTFVPFARDAVGVAIYRAAGTPVTDFTYAELETLYKASATGGSITKNNSASTSVRTIACGIQLGSGTGSFLLTALNGATATAVTAGQEANATSECNALTGTLPAGVSFSTVSGSVGRLQEHDAAGLKAKGDLLAATAGHEGDQVIVFFSAAKFIAKANGAVAGNPGPLGVDLATLSPSAGVGPTGKGYTGTLATSGTSTLAVDATFYANTKFGRDVWNVIPTSILTGPGNTDIKELFVGTTANPTAVLCGSIAAATRATFGFGASSVACGNTANTQGFRPGTFN
jgi:hypothetical protein